jgi:hypothetical protein
MLRREEKTVVVIVVAVCEQIASIDEHEVGSAIQKQIVSLAKM